MDIFNSLHSILLQASTTNVKPIKYVLSTPKMLSTKGKKVIKITKIKIVEASGLKLLNYHLRNISFSVVIVAFYRKWCPKSSL